MRKYFNLTKRNCLVFLRDRSAVFFSLLSMLIVLMLMGIFLARMNVDSVTDLLNTYGGDDRKHTDIKKRITDDLKDCAGRKHRSAADPDICHCCEKREKAKKRSDHHRCGNVGKRHHAFFDRRRVKALQAVFILIADHRSDHRQCARQ